MALLQVEFRSQALQRSVPLQVILPVENQNAPQKFKTLYLLHGLHGSCVDWVANTRIRRWAQAQDLAVVMPSGDNSFYVDRPLSGNCYGEFIGRELVEVTRRMFPLSDRREDTFIGGLSMGGFGALRNGLKYRDNFGAVISLSGAVDIFNMPMTPEEEAFGEAIFGTGAVASDKNPRVLIKLLKGKADLPRIYLCCGTEDPLLPQSRAIRELLEDAGFDVTYEEGPGKHDWDYWDANIQKVLSWLETK